MSNRLPGASQSLSVGAHVATEIAVESPLAPATESISQSSVAAVSTGRFAGKVALVTGASDRGIGGAIARRLSSEGASIAAISRHRPEQLLRRIARRKGQIEFLEGDVCREDDIARMMDATHKRFGRLDIVINNAGLEAFSPLEQMSDVRWQEVIDVNLTGAMRVTRAAIPLLPSPGGVIVNIASALGLGGCEGFTAYSASKAGLIGFTQSLAMELAPRKQRVVAVAPALVLTPMSRQYLQDATEDTWQRVQDSNPLGVGLPEDVAAAVAFLASHEAQWITGITLPLGWFSNFSLPTDVFRRH
jgi:NAD(P)-dependent dehydrogenase (short-subunit alcohol dehydrogenase family)